MMSVCLNVWKIPTVQMATYVMTATGVSWILTTTVLEMTPTVSRVFVTSPGPTQRVSTAILMLACQDVLPMPTVLTCTQCVEQEGGITLVAVMMTHSALLTTYVTLMIMFAKRILDVTVMTPTVSKISVTSRLTGLTRLVNTALTTMGKTVSQDALLMAGALMNTQSVDTVELLIGADVMLMLTVPDSEEPSFVMLRTTTARRDVQMTLTAILMTLNAILKTTHTPPVSTVMLPTVFLDVRLLSLRAVTALLVGPVITIGARHLTDMSSWRASRSLVYQDMAL